MKRLLMIFALCSIGATYTLFAQTTKTFEVDFAVTQERIKDLGGVNAGPDVLPPRGSISIPTAAIQGGNAVAPQTLRSKLDEQASRFWVTVRLILLLGLIALLIAVIGIYGVVAFAVNRRTKEMGIRLALGAAKGNIVGLVLRTSMQPILAGLITGLVFAAAGSYVMVQILREMPIRLELRDPLVYLAVSLLLSLAAVGAIFGPALRAAKSDPLEALRQD